MWLRNARRREFFSRNCNSGALVEEVGVVNLRGGWPVRLSTGLKKWRASMQIVARVWAVAVFLVAGGVAEGAQVPEQTPASPATPAAVSGTPVSAPAAPVQAQATPAITGGRLHGVVKSGNIPLPGVTVTAQNTLTGK